MDRHSQDALYAEAISAHGAAIRRLARGYEADPDRRRDVLQEMHIELWRSLKSFDGRCSLQTWVYRIAHNVGASHVARSRRLAARLVDLESIAAAHSPLDAEAQANRRFSTGSILELIHRLKPLDRQVMLLHLEGEAAGPIGEVTGLSTANVATKIHRIRSCLRSNISKERHMQEPEGSREPATPEHAWISQKEDPDMQIATAADELCAMAHAQERLNARAHWIAAAVVAVLAGSFLYIVFSVEQPWIRVGQAWTLGVISYLYGTMLQRGSRRIRTSEPCANFLEREFENKRRGFLAIRRGLFLLIPGSAVTCWSGGPMVRAKALGLDPVSWRFQFAAGPWPLLIVGIALALVWFAFGKAAEKARRDQSACV